MSARLKRPSPLALCGLLVLAAGVVGMAGTFFVHRIDAFTVFVLGTAGVVGAVTCLVLLEPAWILTGGIVLSVFSGNWGNVGIHLPVDRMAIAGGIGATVVRSLVGSDTPRLRIRTVHWLMALLVLYGIGSAAWSHTLTSHAPLFALLDRLGLVPFLLYLVAPAAFSTDHQRRILAGGLLVLGAYLGLITLFEAVGARSLVVPHYILDPALGIHAERGRGPFLEAGANGLAMFACLVGAALTLSWWRDRRVRAAAVAVIGLCAAGILFTLTRQTWIGAGAGTIAAMLAERRLRVWLPFAGVGAALIVAVALAAIPGLAQNVSHRAADQGPIWDRLNSDNAALRMVEAKPALGFGWGEFGPASPPYYRLAPTYPLSGVGQVHNVPLSNAAELGLVGLALWLAIVLAAIVAPGLRPSAPNLEPWRIALIAVGVAWFIQSNLAPLDYAFDNSIVWLLAGIVTAGPVRRVPAPASESWHRVQPPPVPASAGA